MCGEKKAICDCLNMEATTSWNEAKKFWYSDKKEAGEPRKGTPRLISQGFGLPLYKIDMAKQLLHTEILAYWLL